MKIIPNHEILKTVDPDQNGKKNTPGDNIFKDMLDNSIENSSNKGFESTRMPMPNISGIQFNTINPVDQTPLIDRVGKLIDTLDEYQLKLGDPQYSLRDINPLIQKMETDNKNLESTLNALPDGHGLKDALNQTLVTSTMEVAKFNRGDYI